MYCPFLQSQMPDPKTFKQHFESKHPKSPLPPELEGVEAWTVTLDTKPSSSRPCTNSALVSVWQQWMIWCNQHEAVIFI